MTDIVTRLKAVAAMDLRTGPILAHTLDTAQQAADDIEKMREALRKIVNLDKRHETNCTSQDTGTDGPCGLIARRALEH